MKRTTIFLSDGQRTALKASSRKTGAPVSELIRRAVEEYLRKK